MRGSDQVHAALGGGPSAAKSRLIHHTRPALALAKGSRASPLDLTGYLLNTYTATSPAGSKHSTVSPPATFWVL
jgi:hypothetical protein